MSILQHKPYGPYERFIKRPLDCLLSSLALVVLSPIMGITALLVRSKLGSPVLFSQERPGKEEKLFKIYKFRTMTDARDADGNLLPDVDRLTRFGKILRSTSLDELPELFNIARGDMAIVGPRPLLTQYLPYYRPEERERHAIRPGLTGYAQIHGRNFLMWDERVALDVAYAKHITFIGDLKIILKTVEKVIKRSDVAEKRIPPLDQVRREEMEKAIKE
ncbi:sugar transferase [[Clostridium] aminophilum]|uniref:sugar transferase n=1 Tax=[Clostridium] aminophilum TaxID=1526 RepID=UPI003F990E2C